MSDKPITYSAVGAETFSRSVFNLYSELSKKFGDARAWEFVLTFYKGAGKP